MVTLSEFKGASCPVFLRVFSSVGFVKKKYRPSWVVFTTLYGHNMSPSTLKIHLKSVLFHKSCRNLCVSMPSCIHDTFQWFCLFMNLMSDFAFGKICQKISGIFLKNHLHPCRYLVFYNTVKAHLHFWHRLTTSVAEWHHLPSWFTLWRRSDACVHRTSEFPSWAATFIVCQIMAEDTIETIVGMVDVEESRILLHHDHKMPF
jgi:hypothetical protein